MAVDTLEGGDFVLHPQGTIDVFFFVAGLAGDFGVFSFQREFGSAVVEIRQAPGFEIVASLAIGDTSLFKLPSMHVLVASHAVGVEVFESAVGSGFISRMTSAASSTGMGPFQGKISLSVIEAYGTDPAFW